MFHTIWDVHVQIPIADHEMAVGDSKYDILFIIHTYLFWGNVRPSIQSREVFEVSFILGVS